MTWPPGGAGSGWQHRPGVRITHAPNPLLTVSRTQIGPLRPAGPCAWPLAGRPSLPWEAGSQLADFPAGNWGPGTHHAPWSVPPSPSSSCRCQRERGRDVWRSSSRFEPCGGARCLRWQSDGGSSRQSWTRKSKPQRDTGLRWRGRLSRASQQTTGVSEAPGEGSLVHCRGTQVGAATLQNSVGVLKELKTELPDAPAGTLLGIYPEDMNVVTQRGPRAPRSRQQCPR